MTINCKRQESKQLSFLIFTYKRIKPNLIDNNDRQTHNLIDSSFFSRDASWPPELLQHLVFIFNWQLQGHVVVCPEGQMEAVKLLQGLLV